MYHHLSDRPQVESILDRLIEESSPSVPGRANLKRRPHSLPQIKAQLCRDLENLLNTRTPCDVDDESLDESLAGSLINYGLPDFTSTNLGNPDECEWVRWTIEKTIRRFEPRLEAVSVTLDPPDPLSRTLNFRLDALLRIEPEPEPVRLRTLMEAATAVFRVKGNSHE